MSIQDLRNKITNDSHKSTIDPKSVGSIKQRSTTRPTLSVSNHHLTIVNKGTCPQCDVHVQISDDRVGRNATIWSYSSQNTFGVTPVAFYFNKSTVGSVRGFVMKFWQWDVENKSNAKRNPQAELREAGRSSGSKTFVDEESDEMATRKSYMDDSHFESIQPVLFHNKFSKFYTAAGSEMKHSRITKRLASRYIYGKSWKNTTVFHELKERVVLLTFNDTDIHVINASQSDVVQICQRNNGENICQPNISSEDNSCK